jgi:hypothetical protein
MISGTLFIHDALAPLCVPISEITQYPDNPRAGDIEVIAESMAVNGMYRPIYVHAATGHILAGNHTYAAALSLGATEIPVVRLDCDETTAKRIVLADNRTADLGTYDNAVLVELLSDLQANDSLMGTGYQPLDLEMLQALTEMEPSYDEYASWPTITLTVPPHLKNAFYQFTDHAVSDHDRLEMLLRMAGWRPRGEQQ